MADIIIRHGFITGVFMFGLLYAASSYTTGAVVLKSVAGDYGVLMPDAWLPARWIRLPQAQEAQP